ncbi:uncharacterized protein, partial [Elaeis guineensis]|uniref:uncharacterized protein n=1 Tax=Elaeis guineensis var. tenera TaxID=51953 RepID=UPI003C6D843B
MDPNQPPILPVALIAVTVRPLIPPMTPPLLLVAPTSPPRLGNRRKMSSTTGGGGCDPTPPPFPFSFHLLEVTVVSAQDLFANSRSMRTYAVAWIDPAHKLRTRLDAAGHTEPTWNDKFVFRLDDAILRSDTAAVTVNIFAARPRFLPGSDNLIGTARALLSTLRPSTTTRFVAVQVRRPQSLRPQGILNLGVSLLDAYVRSFPIFAELASDGAPSAIVCNNAPKNKKARPSVDRDGAAVQSKLDQWRSELPPVSDEERMALEAKLAKWRAELPPFPQKERAELDAKLAQWSSEMPPVPAADAKSEKGRRELPPVPIGREHVAIESKLARSPALDEERVALEAKLAQWRSELPPVPRRERAVEAESKGRSELPPPPTDREGAAVELKLAKWREELPAVADGEEKEKGGDGSGGECRMQRRRSIGRLACFAD